MQEALLRRPPREARRGGRGGVGSGSAVGRSATGYNGDSGAGHYRAQFVARGQGQNSALGGRRGGPEPSSHTSRSRARSYREKQSYGAVAASAAVLPANTCYGSIRVPR